MVKRIRFIHPELSKGTIERNYKQLSKLKSTKNVHTSMPTSCIETIWKGTRSWPYLASGFLYRQHTFLYRNTSTIEMEIIIEIDNPFQYSTLNLSYPNL